MKRLSWITISFFVTFLSQACSNTFFVQDYLDFESASSSLGTDTNNSSVPLVTEILNLSDQNKSVLQDGANVIALSEKKKSATGPDLIIAAGETVVIDSDLNVNTLTINGALACSNQYTKEVKIKAQTIYVNGLLECGSSGKNRFVGKLSLALKDGFLNTAAQRGLIVNRGGTLRLFGADQKISWTQLAATANIGSTSLLLDKAIAKGWQAGDKVVIGPTGYNPNESEILDIASISGDGTLIRLAQPLKYNHWGTIQKFQGKSGMVNLDQRAEVANLNRNIQIFADESTDTISDQNGVGGHVMVMPGGRSYIDAVELSRMGQAGIMGRYPFHWHMVGDAYGQFIRNSSIHHSFQRCLTVHTTQRALVQNNVCFDYRGHGYFLEEGDEIDNILIGNLAMFGRRQFPNKVLLDSDRAGSFDESRASAMSGIWISHPRNIVRENTVSGTEGTGIWMSFITGDGENANGRVINKSPVTVNGIKIVPRPTLTDTTDFSNNVAHTNVVGINWDGAPGSEPAPKPGNPSDKLLTSAYYTPPTTPIFTNLNVFKNRITGIYYRGSTAIFDNSVFADNGWNIFVAYNQVVRNSTIIARSNNHDANDEHYMYVEGNSWGRQPTALILYDGPAELQNVNLLNFSTEKVIKKIHGKDHDVTSTLFYDIGGHNKYMNLFTGLYISPNPLYKFTPGFRDEVIAKNFTYQWYDIITSTQSRDLDGSLTGVAGTYILPDVDFMTHPGCIRNVPSFRGFALCNNVERVSNLYVAVNNSYQGGGGVPFLVYRNDGASSLPINDKNIDIDKSLDAIMLPNSTGLNNKFSMLSGHEYTLVLRNKDVVNDFRKRDSVLDMQFSTETMGDMSPVLKIVGLGTQCRLDARDVTKVGSLAELRNANTNAYYNADNDIYIRLKSEKRYDMSSGVTLTKQAVSHAGLYCQAPQPKVMGYYEVERTNGKVALVGWACEQTINQSLGIHFYVSETDGRNSKIIGGFNADQPSENQVLAACGTYKGGYRFRYELSAQQMAEIAGKAIHLYGLSTIGGPNNELSGGQ